MLEGSRCCVGLHFIVSPGESFPSGQDIFPRNDVCCCPVAVFGLLPSARWCKVHRSSVSSYMPAPWCGGALIYYEVREHTLWFVSVVSGTVR